jgi:hypothetical protein
MHLSPRGHSTARDVALDFLRSVWGRKVAQQPETLSRLIGSRTHDCFHRVGPGDIVPDGWRGQYQRTDCSSVRPEHWRPKLSVLGRHSISSCARIAQVNP